MKVSFKRSAAAALAVAALLAAPSVRAADPPTIRLGLICGGLTPMIALVPLDDGSYEKAGIHVERACFSSGPQAVSALIGKSIDAYIGSYDHTLRQRARGFDVKAFAEIYNGYAYLGIAKASAPIKTLADGKGMTFGVTGPGALSDDALHMGLQQAGLNPDRDVSIVAAGSGAPMVAAIETNRVVAGMLADPLATAMVADGKYKIVFNPTEPFAGNVVMAYVDWVKANKPAFTTLLRVMKQSDIAITKNPSSAIAPLQKEFPTVKPRIMLQAIIESLKHVPPGMVVDRATTDPVVAATVKKGDIKAPIPLSEGADNSIVLSLK